MTISSLEPVFEALGYRFRNPALLTEALTHPSQEGEESYERLEFLGDRVLGLIVAERLYEMFPAAEEGRLAPFLNLLVRRETLAKVAGAIGLPEFLTVSPGEDASGGRSKPAILADSCEAVIAAIYRDGGLEAAKAFVLKFWEPHFAALPAEATDPKTALQELLQAQGEALPIYREIGREGPPHDPTFTVEVSSEKGTRATGTGRSKRLAERDAARALLAKLDHKPARKHG